MMSDMSWGKMVLWLAGYWLAQSLVFATGAYVDMSDGALLGYVAATGLIFGGMANLRLAAMAPVVVALVVVGPVGAAGLLVYVPLAEASLLLGLASVRALRWMQSF